MVSDNVVLVWVIGMTAVVCLTAVGCQIHRDYEFVVGGYCQSEVRGVPSDVWVRCGGSR